jgi:hypothetical protein
MYVIQVHVIGALPLRNMSRLWGYINSLELPVWFRPYGFKLYANVFGCNLDEIEQPDLAAYKSLGDFFYRKLKPGVRPVDGAALVSSASRRENETDDGASIGQPSGWHDSPFWNDYRSEGRTSQRHHVFP